MQEAMDMTPEEFDEAAHRLLQAEQVQMMPHFCAWAIHSHVTSALGGGGVAQNVTTVLISCVNVTVQ